MRLARGPGRYVRFPRTHPDLYPTPPERGTREFRGPGVENGEKKLYQEGGVTAMRPPEELIGLYMPGETQLPAGMAMYCGTLAAIGGIRPAERFDVEIEDPVLGRKISYGYNVNPLPVVT